MVVTNIGFIIVGILSIIYFYVRRKFNFWRKHNIPHIEPAFPFGNLKDSMGKKHLYFNTQDFYNEMKGQGPFGGIHLLLQSAILALDIEFVKKILIKDFNYFEDRGVYYNEKDDPLSAHLFSLDGKSWRKLRSKLSPTFTSGKMKFMFPTVVEVGEKFKNYLTDVVISSNERTVEIKDLLARFTTDVIGTCAFGIECNSMTDPNSRFLEMGKKTFTKPRHHPLLGFLINIFDDLSRFARIKAINDDVSEFFINIVKDTIKYREESNLQRNDFMDILIKLKNQSKNDDENSDPLSFNEIAAQAFIFFLAGFETSSTTMTFTLYELAMNQQIQDRVRTEINDVLERHNGEFTYEAMLDMQYLDQIINETLRKYPPAGLLFRKVTKEYYVPEFDFTLAKGTVAWIPVYAIHHDPEMYPNPEVFDPERFTTEQVKNRNAMTFLPFGDGPRNCVGLRFGLMQVRVGLVMLLQHFKFTISERTTVPLEISPTEFILSPKGGLFLNVSKL